MHGCPYCESGGHSDMAAQSGYTLPYPPFGVQGLPLVYHQQRMYATLPSVFVKQREEILPKQRGYPT